ncbi:acyl-CoA dehydrogenase [Spirillospora sp. NPDC047279]|uniref:acyl-CoA dehydrogenase family protein n=1 Tax=Spirillospora sp. NPDC047279 TaxID=3155478 RepID=UPI00340C91EF
MTLSRAHVEDVPPVASVHAGLGARLSLGGAAGDAAEFRDRVRALIRERVAPLLPDAEDARRFPREAVAAFGSAGLFHERWTGGRHGDLGRSVLLSEEMGRAGLGGIGIGVGLHLEAALPLLYRFGRTDLAKDALERGLSGTAVCCVATSEKDVGSDLSAVGAELRRDGTGWRVRGTKWFVSPGAAADLVLVLCRAEDGPAVVLVERDGVEVVKRLRTAGMRGLETARLSIDAHVPDEAVVARPGHGLSALLAGLMYERLAISAQIMGTLDLALTLAATHLRRRRQFGRPLVDHQALRLRLADLVSEVTITRRGLYGTVTELDAGAPVTVCDIAGIKAVAGRLGERVASECLQFFGGSGYLEDETPLARLWRDLRVCRIGGGTDEMMLEIVARGVRGDARLYEEWVERG